MPPAGNPSIVVDIPFWLARTTLDAIGQGETRAVIQHWFSCPFFCNSCFRSWLWSHRWLKQWAIYCLYKSPVSPNVTYGCVPCVRIDMYTRADTFFKRSNAVIAFEALWGYLPLWMVTAIQLLPTKQLKRIRKYTTVAHRVAKNIVDTQTQLYSLGKEGGKDIMSILSKFYKELVPSCFNNSVWSALLVRANLSENPETKLSEAEAISQLKCGSIFSGADIINHLNIATRILMIAGQETTATTLTWAFYELSRNPEFQAQVREEIKTTRAEAVRRGGGELTVADLDSMHNVLAVIKVGS